MFCALEKLKIGMSASLLLGLFLTAHGEYLRGGLNSKYLSLIRNDMNWKQCGNDICGKDALNCHFVHTQSDECYKINPPLLLLVKWGVQEKIRIKDKKMTIYYFYTDFTDIMIEKNPRVWWILDNVSKGRNFGTAGSAMDIPVATVVWKSEATGPRDGSPLLYGEGKYEKVAVEHNGKLLLDTVKTFTISMWIKTRPGNEYKYLLGGSPWQAMRFSFWPTKELNLISLAMDGVVKNHYKTKINNTGINDWRHVAVVYEPGTSPNFFLNGNMWPLEDDHDSPKAVRTTLLTLWNSGSGGKHHLDGQIACVMVFQAYLSPSQIKILKDNCP